MKLFLLSDLLTDGKWIKQKSFATSWHPVQHNTHPHNADHTSLLVVHKQAGSYRWIVGSGSCIWGALFFFACVYFWACSPIMSDSFCNKALELILTRLGQCLSASGVSVCVFMYMKLRMSVWLTAAVTFRDEVNVALIKCYTNMCHVFIYC